MKRLDAVIKEAGYVTTTGAYKHVHGLVDDGRPHRFATVEALVDDLFRNELLYKPARGGRSVRGRSESRPGSPARPTGSGPSPDRPDGT